MDKHYLPKRTINGLARDAYYAYHKVLEILEGTLDVRSGVNLTKDSALSTVPADAPLCTKEQKAPWLAVAEMTASRMRGWAIRKGSRATLRASIGFPATEIVLVKMFEEPMCKVRFPDGKVKTFSFVSLIDWCSDWYNDEDRISTHMDNFGPRAPHPVTGQDWPKGVAPDLMKAWEILSPGETREVKRHAAKTKPKAKKKTR